MDQAKSWLKENSSLALFLVAQVIAFGAAAATIIAYSVKLETRVHIMETRGAEYTVARIAEIQNRITVIEQRQTRNEVQIEKLVSEFIKELQRQQQMQPRQ